MSTIRKIWGMWPDIETMAEELGDSVNALRRERDAGRLPDSRHDRAIVVRARAMNRRITYAVLSDLRSRRPEIELADRKAMIAKFYEAAGGEKAVSERTGTSLTHLYSNKSKGFLNRSKRFEYKGLAADIGFDLPEMIFSQPK